MKRSHIVEWQTVTGMDERRKTNIDRTQVVAGLGWIIGDLGLSVGEVGGIFAVQRL